MINLILLATSLLVLVNLAIMKVEMSDGSFYRPIAETVLCSFVIVVCCYLV